MNLELTITSFFLNILCQILGSCYMLGNIVYRQTKKGKCKKQKEEKREKHK